MSRPLGWCGGGGGDGDLHSYSLMAHCQLPNVITDHQYPEQVSSLEVNWQDNDQRCKSIH